MRTLILALALLAASVSADSLALPKLRILAEGGLAETARPFLRELADHDVRPPAVERRDQVSGRRRMSSGGVLTVSAARTCRTRPTTPSATSRCTSRVRGW